MCETTSQNLAERLKRPENGSTSGSREITQGNAFAQRGSSFEFWPIDLRIAGSIPGAACCLMLWTYRAIEHIPRGRKACAKAAPLQTPDVAG